MSCSAGSTVVCEWGESVDPGDQLVMSVTLAVAPEPEVFGSPVNRVSVSGGGAASASASVPVSVGGAPAPFGPEPNSVLAAVSSPQAGAHSNATAAFTLNTEEPDAVVGRREGYPRRSAAGAGRHDRRDAAVRDRRRSSKRLIEPNGCPADTMVGMATLTLSEGTALDRIATLVTPVYNISPAPGEPAAFAFNAFFLSVRLDTSVLSDGNYGVRVARVGDLAGGGGDVRLGDDLGCSGGSQRPGP